MVDHLPTLLVEIKGDTPDWLDRIVPATLAEITRRELGDRVTLTSFDPYALELARREAPLIRRGFIGDWNEPHYLDTAIALGCVQIDARHATADRGLVAQAKDQGMRVVGWPTNSAEDLASVRALAADLACTDAPTLLMKMYRHGTGPS